MKAIVTVVGKDRVGIIADVCSFLAGCNINILDISQTVRQGYFNMMMVVDGDACTKPFGEIAKELHDHGEAVGLSIQIQREEIFEAMHRV